ncbi:AMP-binding protein [Actinopolymorpha sp. B9G3]|uniref:AMP-binding protein n=1 Tax=Actinopolymorpha sp. B9G3 TaxID=3158970 RepID=UPI0032D8C677
MALRAVPRQGIPRPRAPKAASARLQPNLGDYVRVRRDFSWDAARTWLTGLPEGRGLNIAYEAVDRHATGQRARQAALRCRDAHGQLTELTYEELRTSTNRFASLLETLGVEAGHRVFSLLGKVPETYLTALGALKVGGVYGSLPVDSDSDAIRARMELAGVRVLVTTAELYKRRIAPMRDSLPDLTHVLVVGESEGVETIDLHAALADMDESFVIPPTDESDPALVCFTGGTTGPPKATLFPHEAVVAQHATAAYALDLHAGDVVWCAADCVEAASVSYGIVAPLTHGATAVADATAFDVRGTYELLQQARVSVWYTTPGALRAMRHEGSDLARSYDLSALRFIASVGEPLDPELVLWGQDAFGRPVHDTWCQTETGTITISNFASMDIRPGSMGRPMPGVKVALLGRGSDGRPELVDGELREINDPYEVGEIAVRPGCPSLFRGYLGDGEPEGIDSCLTAGWHLTGDLARRDNDGYFWYAGRVADAIATGGDGGPPIGAYDIERILLEHPAVAEAAVVAKPDPAGGEAVKAYLTLHPDRSPDDDMRSEVLEFAAKRLSTLAPAEVEFVPRLPRNRNGSLLRQDLRTPVADTP